MTKSVQGDSCIADRDAGSPTQTDYMDPSNSLLKDNCFFFL